MRILAALALTFAVSACAATPATDCAGFRTIHPTNADVDVISDKLVEQILAHNEFMRRHCR